MAERTHSADSEKAEGIAPDKTVDIDGGGVLPTEAPVVTKDGSEIKRRTKRNIIIAPEWSSVEIERNGTKYCRDTNGRWRPVLY